MCSVSSRDIKLCTEEPDSPAPLFFLEAANAVTTTHGLQFPATI